MKTHSAIPVVSTLILTTALCFRALCADAVGDFNTLTAQEKADGWKLLWDGKTSTGWKSVKADTFPEKGWTIKDGVLTVLGKAGGT